MVGDSEDKTTKMQFYRADLKKKKKKSWVGEMAYPVKVLAIRPDDLNSVPRTHMVEREPVPSGCSLTIHFLWHTQT